MSALRFALRSLAKSPGFTAVVVLTLGLTVGAATAVFSVVRGTLLRPPPYPEPGRIAVLRTAHRPELSDFNASPGEFLGWRDQLKSFAALAALTPQSFIFTGAAEPQRLDGTRATADVFAVYRTAPELGRVFRPDEDRPGADAVALISHDFWQQQFGGAPDVLGRTLSLDGRPRTIVGVMPADFLRAERVAVWVPMAFSDEERSDAYRGARYLDVVGRLRPGITWAQAQAELDLAAARLAREYPDFNRGWTVAATPLADYAVRHVRVVLWTLLGAVACVLAVACSNLAGVTLARGIARTHELAIRASLGATRPQLVRQLFLESLLLAVAGGIAGGLVASWSLDVVAGAFPVRPGEGVLDVRVLACAAGLSGVTSVLFGLLPAWRLSQVAPGNALKLYATGLTAAPAHTRTRRVLAVVQIAVAIALLAGTTLLVRSLQRLTSVDPGFNPRDAFAAQIDLPATSYDTPAQQQAFAQQVLERVRALPGVTAAGVTQALPLRGNWNVDFLIDGRPPAPDGGQKAGYFSVSPDYFPAMGIRLVRGRGFAETDSASAPPVVIVNEAFARRYFPAGNAVGQRLHLMNGPWRSSEIVGIVADVKQTSLAQPAPPQAYEPFAQWTRPNFTLVVRAPGPAAGAVPAALRQAVFAVDPHQPVTTLLPLDSVVADATRAPRLVAALLSAFSVVAAGIATLGVFGVMMQTVTLRTREFGVRVALGASPERLLRQVLAQGACLVALGGGLGLALAAAAVPLVRSLLFDTGFHDATVLSAVVAAMALIALLACWLPARRATQVDPLTALRSE